MTQDTETIGWFFVQEYYTTLNKTPLSLHRFYMKDSTFVHGNEGESADPYTGQSEIHKRIIDLDFMDCKVLVSNVDSQPSSNGGIMIQVIGEMSNKNCPSSKFAQTFFLSTQANGFYVLNDMLRFLKEDVDTLYEKTEDPLISNPINHLNGIHSEETPRISTTVHSFNSETKSREEKLVEFREQEVKPNPSPIQLMHGKASSVTPKLNEPHVATLDDKPKSLQTHTSPTKVQSSTPNQVNQPKLSTTTKSLSTPQQSTQINGATGKPFKQHTTINEDKLEHISNILPSSKNPTNQHEEQQHGKEQPLASNAKNSNTQQQQQQQQQLLEQPQLSNNTKIINSNNKEQIPPFKSVSLTLSTEEKIDEINGVTPFEIRVEKVIGVVEEEEEVEERKAVELIVSPPKPSTWATRAASAKFTTPTTATTTSTTPITTTTATSNTTPTSSQTVSRVKQANEPSSTQIEVREKFSCYVKNLSPGTTEQHLRNAFVYIGQIKRVEILRDKNVAFVEFLVSEVCFVAIGQSAIVNGKVLVLEERKKNPIKVEGQKYHKDKEKKPSKEKKYVGKDVKRA